jgi:hypothetical protein
MKENKMYTVTSTSTHFVEADNANEALGKVYEALLGNDHEEILGNSEVHLFSMTVKSGYHSTIKDSNYGR